MKKRIVIANLLLLMLVFVGSFTGCGSSSSSSLAQKEATTEEVTEAETEAETEVETTKAPVETDDVTVRVEALKGPTTIGLVNLMADAKANAANGNYEFTMLTGGAEIMADMVAGKADIGLVPSNVAAIMNSKVEGGVSVIDINTLGVLYCVTGDSSVKGVADLAGKTVYLTGQGATPEYTLRYLLDQKGITDCSLEFKSEPTEIAALLAKDPNAVAVLPQPFVIAALAQNEAVKLAFSLDSAFSEVNTECSIVTGVTVVSNKFLKEHPLAVDAFIEAHKASADKANSDVEGTAKLVVEQGIIAKEPIAVKAIPQCNICCMTGSEMKDTLSGYLKVLFDQEPKAVGGTLPSDDFYYVK
ncbi:MAG: ABC transporter substrate-binding protein [Lachnospiraceae bacterium]|nr:ABC transporter substrate-binding protein [Lachnospiraceae bacterium]